MKSFQRSPALIATGVCFILIAIQSCYYPRTKPGWEYMPDMVNAITYETNTPNPNFPDSMTEQTPVSGTIPRGVFMPFHFSANASGYDSAGAMLHFPTWLTEDDKTEGKRLFEIYCAVCHGKDGKADGSIVVNDKLKNPFPPPPSYFDDAHVNLPEGKMYYSAHYGKNLMGPYSKLLDANQLWKVIYYVKGMQMDYLKSLTPATASADTTKAKK